MKVTAQRTARDFALCMRDLVDTYYPEAELEVLLWGFNNSRDGRCFPSYERIATPAGCCRDTVCEAIKALEAAGVLSWVNRLLGIQVRELDLVGRWSWRWRLVRTSNAYAFRDPGAGLVAAAAPRPSKSEIGREHPFKNLLTLRGRAGGIRGRQEGRTGSADASAGATGEGADGVNECPAGA